MKKVFAALLFMLTIPLSAFAAQDIRPGDLLGVTVYQNPDLTKEIEVSENGTITFPLVGEVSVSGNTPLAAADIIEKKLVQGGFVRQPQVIVTIIESRARTVSIFGQVRSPGKYQIEIGATTVVDFLTVAGGLLPAASNTVIIAKNSESKEPRKITIDLDSLFKSDDLKGLNSPDMELDSGDIIYVPKAFLFYVYGEVNRPGSYVLEKGMTVMQAISVSGGISPKGSYGGVVIKRQDSSGNVTEIEAEESTKLLENDVVFVEESFF